MKKISVLFCILFCASLFAESPTNRISISASAWPPFFMYFTGHAGLTYDRIVSERFSVNAGGNFEGYGHMHGYLMGGGVEIGSKFMVYSHSENPFRKGVVIGLSTGTNFGESVATGGDPRDRKENSIFKIWFPLNAQVAYLYTWENNVFLGGGVRSQLFSIDYTKENTKLVARNAYPQLEVQFGIAF